MATFLKSANFNGSNGGHFYLSIYYDMVEQDISNNQSKVRYYLYVGSYDSYSGSGSTGNSYINDTWIASFTRIGARSNNYMGYKDVTYTHKSDGTGTATYSARATTNWSGIGTASLSGSFALPTIPRSASVSTESARVGEECTIKINRLTNIFNYTLRYSIDDDNGITHTDTIVTNINQDEYKWVVPDVIYQYWRTGDIKFFTIYCDTYNGDKLIGTKSANIQISVTLKTIPLIANYDFRDMSSKTVALTDDNGVMVQGYSAGRLTFIATLDYYSKVSEVLDENRKPVEYEVVSETDKTQVISIEIVYNNFSSLHQIWVWDGRRMAGRIGIRTKNMAKMPGTIEIIYERVDYIPLTLNMTASRPNATSGEIDVSFSGNYFNSDFGGADNSLDLSWKYKIKDATSWTDGGTFTKDTDYTIQDNTFESTGAVNLGAIFNYENIYEIAIFYKDKLVDGYISKIVTRGLPIFWWNQDGVYDGYNRKFLVEGEASGGDTLPIGAIVDYDGDIVPEGYEEIPESSGTNENGSWIKFADGTMIINKTIKGSTNIATAWGSLFVSSDINLGAFPVEFVERPTIVVSPQTQTGTQYFLLGSGGVASGTGSTIGNVALCRPNSRTNVAYILDVIAKGRWK